MKQLSPNWLCGSPAEEEKGHIVSRNKSKLPKDSRDFVVPGEDLGSFCPWDFFCLFLVKALSGNLKQVDTTMGKPTKSARASGGTLRPSKLASPEENDSDMDRSGLCQKANLTCLIS